MCCWRGSTSISAWPISKAACATWSSDVESAYWELSFAWRNLETSNTALASARQTWKKIYLLYQIGTKGGEAAQEAQAREQYFQFKSQTQTLLNELVAGRKPAALGDGPVHQRLAG